MSCTKQFESKSQQAARMVLGAYHFCRGDRLKRRTEFQLRLERDTIELLNGFAAEAVMLPPKYASLQAWCKHREKKSAARAICRWLEWLLEVDLPGWLTEDVMMADIEQ
jgi:hypothetical protein